MEQRDDDLVAFILRQAVELGGLEASVVQRIDLMAREQWGGRRTYVAMTQARRSGQRPIAPDVVERAVMAHDAGTPVSQVTKSHPIGKTALYAYLSRRTRR